jgi:hypothetical protein
MDDNCLAYAESNEYNSQNVFFNHGQEAHRRPLYRIFQFCYVKRANDKEIMHVQESSRSG